MQQNVRSRKVRYLASYFLSLTPRLNEGVFTNQVKHFC